MIEAAIANRPNANIDPRATFFFHEMRSLGTSQSGIAITMMSVITARMQYITSAVFEDSPHTDSVKSTYLSFRLGNTEVVGIKVVDDGTAVEDLSQVAADQGNTEPDSGT
jgi:hypothetical protein